MTTNIKEHLIWLFKVIDIFLYSCSRKKVKHYKKKIPMEFQVGENNLESHIFNIYYTKRV